MAGAVAAATLHGMVEAQVDRAPDAEAFRFRGATTTYRELDDQANRFAHALIAHGVRPGYRVGVCLERGPHLVAALLGVLKAGACYVPLDPAYPPARIAYMAQDSGLSVLLTDGEPAGTAEDAESTRTLTVADLTSADRPAHRPAIDTQPDCLAYLIYTSGSSGRPKGVAIEHRSAVALLHWVRSSFSRQEMSGMLASTSVCFDLSVFEIFGTLSRGGRFILVRNILALAELDVADGVRFVNAVPTAVGELLAAGAVPASVTTVAMAGEPLPGPVVQALYALPHVERVLNLYGPSEDTTYSTWAELEPGDEGSPPIGHPLPGTRAYVLDADLRQVADGVPGELYLSGAGLARGYFDRRRETAERFLPDPYASEPGARMYRTGDRVVRSEGGRLAFLGRIDTMVKIRGYRIEPGEVAAVLAEAPGVRQAAAAAVPGPAGTLRLVGYVVPDPARRPDCGAVLAHARDRLPAYMIPTDLVQLERLPVTPNGKVDAKALPAPDRSAGRGVTPMAPPRGAEEETVAEVFREVLGVEVGRDDDFFALGGDSLQATRVVTRLRAKSGRAVPLVAVFESPMVGALAARLRTADPAAPAGLAELAGALVPLSSAQHRMWFLDQLEPNDTSYLISVIVELRGVRDEEHLCGALRDLVAAHAALRTEFVTVGDEPRQRVLPTAVLPLTRVTADPAGLAGTLARLADEEASRPIELTGAPLARCAVVSVAGEPAALVLTAHHIIFDGWSTGLFVDELGRRYEQRVQGRPERPSAAAGPAEVGEAQRCWLAGSEGRTALDELAHSLRGVPNLLPLPTDLPRPAERTSQGAHLRVRLPARTTELVYGLAEEHRATPYMVGLTAFSALLAEWTGTSDLVIATAFAGRTSIEAENSIGCFVNTVPLRVRVVPEAPFAERLRSVRHASLFAAARQDVPFEFLVERLSPPRSMSHNPLVQVAFGVQNAGSLTYRSSGIELTAVRREPDEARLDLTLWLEPQPDGLTALWTYSTELFHPATIDALHQRFVQLLAPKGKHHG